MSHNKKEIKNKYITVTKLLSVTVGAVEEFGSHWSILSVVE